MTPPQDSADAPRAIDAVWDHTGAWRLVHRTTLVVLTIAALLLLWTVRDILVLIFGSILLSVGLIAAAELVQRHSGLRYGSSLVAVVVLLAAAIGLAAALLGPQIANQFAQLWQTLPLSLSGLQTYLQNQEWGRQLLAAAQEFNIQDVAGTAWSVMRTAIGWFLAALSGLLIVAFAALYLAAQPGLYRRGAVRLVPPAERERVRRLFDVTEAALRRWLLGQLVAMLSVGLLTAIGLWLLGVPAALALGLIAGLAEFIPIIGPIIAAVPGILFASAQGLDQAFYVTLFYIALQQFESYVIAPMIQREAVELPPIITIFAVVIFGAVVGPLGVLFATPLAVLAMVWVKVLYLEGVLGERVVLPGQ